MDWLITELTREGEGPLPPHRRDGPVGGDAGGGAVGAECEDGESKISFEPVQAGFYIHLGYGKCLTYDDVHNLHRANQLQYNPYNRQRFSTEQRTKIDAMLRGARVAP